MPARAKQPRQPSATVERQQKKRKRGEEEEDEEYIPEQETSRKRVRLVKDTVGKTKDIQKKVLNKEAVKKVVKKVAEKKPVAPAAAPPTSQKRKRVEEDYNEEYIPTKKAKSLNDSENTQEIVLSILRRVQAIARKADEFAAAPPEYEPLQLKGKRPSSSEIEPGLPLPKKPKSAALEKKRTKPPVIYKKKGAAYWKWQAKKAELEEFMKTYSGGRFPRMPVWSEVQREFRVSRYPQAQLEEDEDLTDTEDTQAKPLSKRGAAKKAATKMRSRRAQDDTRGQALLAFNHGAHKEIQVRSTASSNDAANLQSHVKKNKDGEERNIDFVLFGEMKFKAWYPSWYPKEVIGDTEGKSKEQPVVKELCVCRRCFAYGVDEEEGVKNKKWLKHFDICKKNVPGREIYRHGGWEEGKGKSRMSVFEVDGAVDTTFCQKLSLFAKLFLDNKSVFFDVSGFNYFLLVHTSSSSQQQIIGFFSKEKKSWDENNLACILIFPPWQRKGLGALLIGISYSIARREGVLGGPEKPISELGMRGYKRYWSREVARWLLSLSVSTGRWAKGKDISLNDVSEGTWITPDDCLLVMREMGVAEIVEEPVSKTTKERAKSEEVVKSVNGDETQKSVVKVRIDKQMIMEWCQAKNISLERLVGEEGFLDGYAIPVAIGEEDADAEEMEDEMEVQSGRCLYGANG